MSEAEKEKVKDLPNKMEEYYFDPNNEFRYVISPDTDFIFREYKFKEDMLVLEEILDKYNRMQTDDKRNVYEVVPISPKDFPITALEDYFNE